MLNHQTILRTLVLLLASSSLLCSAWWEAGHMITAQIAKNELLKSDPLIYRVAEEMALFGGDLSLAFTPDFAATAVWADTVKAQDVNMWDDWHFIDLPINNDGLLLNFDKGETSNAVWAIKNILGVLNCTDTANKTTIEKSIMTRLLLHFVGDLHQPLHTASLYNVSLMSGDEGGNLFNISYKLSARNLTNLHALWDDGAGLLPDITTIPFSADDLDKVRQMAANIMQKYPPTALSNELSLDTIDDWARESLYHAQQRVYAPLMGTAKAGVVEITEDYQQNAYALIERQLALGGYRLAQLLRVAFANQTLDAILGGRHHEPLTVKHYLRRRKSIQYSPIVIASSETVSTFLLFFLRIFSFVVEEIIKIYQLLQECI
eukprot:TRINITY_DN90_c0_g1_i2.p1 TRINITY_DN90_c0_g1~~TRINITY_DN90_c0_g1_i2.p1  ORF type:complete len:376 (+),score=94.37 TRINITY_DN90_c0_g1_i2:238-1365(+)